MSQAHVLRQQAEQFLLKHPELADAIAELVLEERTRESGELVGGLTPGLRRVFNFIVSYQMCHGISPSYSEMCEKLSLGRANLARMLRLLKERGYISYIKNKARSITVLAAGRNALSTVRPNTLERLAA
jgi:hypothetical protein